MAPVYTKPPQFTALAAAGDAATTALFALGKDGMVYRLCWMPDLGDGSAPVCYWRQVAAHVETEA